MRSQGAVRAEDPRPPSRLSTADPEQKPDPRLIAGASLSQNSPAPTPAPSASRAPLCSSWAAALHIKGRQRSLFTPRFPQMAPHRSTPEQGPGGEGILGTASMPLTSHFPTAKACSEGDIALPFF